MHMIDDTNLPPEVEFDGGIEPAGFALDMDDADGAPPGAEGKQEDEGKEEAEAAAAAAEAAKAAENEGKPAEGAPVDLKDDLVFKVGEEEIAGSEIRSLLNERTQIQAFREENAAALGVTEFISRLPPTELQELIAYAETLDARLAGKAPEGKASASVPAIQIPDGYTPEKIRWEDLSDESRATMAMLSPVVNRLQVLEAQLAQQGQKVDAMGRIIPEVQTYVQGSRQERQQTDAIAAIKADVGIEITPAELQGAMKATGVQDPQAAWLKLNAKRVAEAGAAAVMARQGNKPPNSPQSQGKTFDPEGMTADQIFNHLQSGLEPIPK